MRMGAIIGASPIDWSRAVVQTAGTVSHRIGGPMTVPDCSIPLPGFRRCKKCGTVRPLDDFPRFSAPGIGHEHRCKPCRDRYYRGFYARHRRELIRYAADWKRAHPDEVAAGRVGAYSRRLARDPDHARAVVARNTTTRKARVRGAPRAETIDRRVLFVRDGGICYLCGLPVDPDDWHIDHVTPVVAGGTHTYDNVAVTHPVCNLRKGRRVGGAS